MHHPSTNVPQTPSLLSPESSHLLLNIATEILKTNLPCIK